MILDDFLHKYNQNLHLIYEITCILGNITAISPQACNTFHELYF